MRLKQPYTATEADYPPVEQIWRDSAKLAANLLDNPQLAERLKAANFPAWLELQQALSSLRAMASRLNEEQL